MQAENEQPIPLTEAERQKRLKQVRKVVLIRGFFLGLIVACWWIFFAPEEVLSGSLKTPLGIAAGIIASGAYWFMLRQTLFPPKSAHPPA